jgi:hypothetical protein
MLPPPLQSSLPAGWLASTGRESNPLDRYKRFQITFSSPFSGFILAQGKFHDVLMSFGDEISRISLQKYTDFRWSRKGAGGGSWPDPEATGAAQHGC